MITGSKGRHLDSAGRGLHTEPAYQNLGTGELLGNLERIDGFPGFGNLLQTESSSFYIYHAQRMDLRDESVGEALPTGWVGLLFGIVELSSARATHDCLDGYTEAENRGWDKDYNFGSKEGVMPRWQAAVRAHPDFISTDQVEEVAKLLRASH